MKVWGVPGDASPAEWVCLSYDLDWSISGGIWCKELGPTRFQVVVVVPTSGWGSATSKFFGHAKYIDLASLSLSEVQGLLGTTDVKREPLDLARDVLANHPSWQLKLVKLAFVAGKGLGCGAEDGKTVVAIRTKLKECKLPGNSVEEVGTEALPFVAAQRKKARKKNPKGYTLGFLYGMKLKPLPLQDDASVETGWRHGLDYASGRVPLPEWFNTPQLVD